MKAKDQEYQDFLDSKKEEEEREEAYQAKYKVGMTIDPIEDYEVIFSLTE